MSKPVITSALASSSLSIAVPEVTCRAGASAELAQHVRSQGHERAFLVADPGVMAAGIGEPIVEALRASGIETEVFSQIEPNPTDRNVTAGVEALRAFGDSVVVLLGGGSAMDAGKTIALAAVNEGDALEYLYQPKLAGDSIDFTTLAPARTATVDAPPVIAVPTTSGTASETNEFAVVTDTAIDRKLLLNAPSVKPRHVLLDPALTLGLPPVPTATCGMDALTHSIEAYTSANPNPFSDAVALGAIGLVAQWLPVAVESGDDLEARSQMMLAAHMAGIAFSNGPALGLVHAMGHPLSAKLHAAHGQTLSTMLPHVMRYNLETVRDRYARIGEALGCPPSDDPTAGAEAAIESISALSARVGTDRSIRDLGGDEDLIPALVDDALCDLVILTTARPPSRSDVHDLYLSAL